MLKKFFKHTTNTFKSLFIIFKHLFKKPVTLEYPEKRKILPKKFRGKPSLKSGCVKCRTCIRVCPSGAIKLDDNNNIRISKNITKCTIPTPNKECIELYNNSNIDEYISDNTKILSIELNDEEKIEWIHNLIGNTYIEKYNKVKDTIMLSKRTKHFYLYFLNSFRTEDTKFSHTMLLNLANANNVDLLQIWKKSFTNIINMSVNDIPEDKIDIFVKLHEIAQAFLLYNDEEILSLFSKILMYKCSEKVENDQPNGWKLNLGGTLDYYSGKESDYGIGAIAGFNDFQLALDSDVQLYYIFYMVAYVITNIKNSISKYFTLDSIKNINYYEHNAGKLFLMQQCGIISNDKDIQPNLDNFDFTPMVDIFKKIVDKQMKKLKIK